MRPSMVAEQNVVTSVEDSDVVEEDATVTTARMLEQTFAKPTSLYRRIDVGNFEETIVPIDLLQLRRSDVKKSFTIWNWDFWCQLQPKAGNCSAKHEKIYYNAQLDQCSTFIYSGCNGNKNRFNTMIDCERHCKGAAHVTLKNSNKLTFCELQSDAGDCIGFFRRYYYDVNKDTCNVFMYGGCGGNQNRFETRRKCLRYCSTGNYDVSDDY
ncbi:hypothetical protein K1T71_007131 [Dendrolimus kikuchii]|uniref:Uncharacterized protein n=1 Tax=Dendrolimus kikuchii TaxID=765133 RepID=A0ACC1CZU3_9NEOP|nr:hypothetical protein K1T71_007131 [Dendrolimus kikuchii]